MLINLKINRINIFRIQWFCLFGVFRPPREYFTQIEKSPLPVKGCKFWPMVSTHSYCAVRFFSVLYILWQGAFVFNCLRTSDTYIYSPAFGTGAVSTCFYDSGLSRLRFKHPSFRLRSERIQWKIREKHHMVNMSGL